MRAWRYIATIFAVGVLAFTVHRMVIRYVPNMVFAIAKQRSAQPLNTVIHAPKTDAKLRRVVLPNPDFVYSAIFYDVSQHDLVISGELPDSSQYACIAFYADDMQPYYVVNNQKGLIGAYQFRLSKDAGSKDDLTRIQTKTTQGSILVRLLYTDTLQEARARFFQKQLTAVAVE